VNRPTQSDRSIFVLLIALVLWLPLPWGSKPAAATAGFTFFVSLLALSRLVMRARGVATPRLPRAAKIATALWILSLAWGAIYALPLSPRLLETVSPASYANHAAVQSLGVNALFTLSAQPGITVQNVLLGASYFALFWLVLVTVARNRPRQRLLLAAVALSGLVQSLYGTLMTLSGWELGGAFEPKVHGIGWATGTFVNRNHLAGYLELALPAAIALVLADLRPSAATTWRQRLENLVDLGLSSRFRVRIMILGMVVGLVMTRSRGGSLAFFAALAVCSGVYVLIRHPRYLGKTLIFVLSLMVVDVLVISQQYGLSKLAARIEATDLETEQRTLALRDMGPLVADYAFVGSGPGTFAAVFSPYRSADVRRHYDHAHNDHLEFLIETGVVGYGLLGALVFLALTHSVALARRRRDPMAAAIGFASAMGLVSLLFHGFVDFNFHIPAVAATLVTLLATAFSVSSDPGESGRRGELDRLDPMAQRPTDIQ
jgi:putative inorganic carbon (hco3(-)) transporter